MKPTRLSRIGPEPAGLETEKYVVDNGHIIGYNATHVMSRGWAWPRAGSVAFSLDLWSQGIVLCVLCGVWAARMCPSQCTKNPGIFDANDVVCHRCAQPIGPLPAVILGIFTAVIVGVLLTRTLSRWSSMHSHFASIVSNVRDLSQRLTAHMSGPTPEEQAVRNRLHRLQLAALVLLTQRLRNERDLEALERRKLLRYRERARLGSAGGAHSVVYSWMCGVLAEYSKIPNTPFSRCPGAVGHANGMEQSIGRQQRHADALESLLDTQDPFAFVHLAAVTVKLTLVVVALWAAEYVRLGHDNESYSALTFGFLLVLVINFAAEGTLQVHAALHRPFGYRAGDMAQHMYIRSAVSLCTDTFDRDWASVSRGRVDSKLSAQKRRGGVAADRADHKERTGRTRVAEARSQSRRRRENERSAADMPTTEPRGGQYGSHKSAKSTKSAKSHRSAKVMHPWGYHSLLPQVREQCPSCCCEAAKMSGVSPYLSVTFRLHLFSRSSITISVWPLVDAPCSGALPSPSCQSTGAPSAMSLLASAVFPSHRHQKFLVDVQSAFQGRVSACGPAASAASYLCFGSIGRSMVDRLAEQGLNVIIVALPGILLQNTAKDLETRYPNQRFEAIGVNFSPGVDYMAPIVSATRDKAVQIVVSNAGYIKTGFFDQLSANQNIALIECNAVACVRIAHYFVSQMVSSRRRGCVIITSSMAAYMPTGLVSMYGATKAFLSSFGAALYAENSSRGVDICTAHPAAVSTRLGSDTRPLDASAFFNLFALDPR